MMDKGAHYFCCDFQIHSPRDRQWAGRKFGFDSNEVLSLSDDAKAQVKTDRLQFAKEYLERIRNANLRAIAVTDHHDVVFAKIIREVAESENKISIEEGASEKIITVFPGIELTLANPVSQCLLIFDADFLDDSLDKVISFLGINPSHELEKSTAETTRISQDIINDLLQLHKKLDELTYCKGRYVVLPNINDGGKHSILRTGFHEHYRKMPCVGGYVDQSISSDTGYLNKINGGDINYGNKTIGVISTSDNRYEDGRGLGKFFTWIKWAEPTAEALRQACLAKESRISQENPVLPEVYITFIDVTASKFLGNFTINFNRQYNALIGGRGTGKSTILEYIRWALCDQTSISSSEEEVSTIEKKRQNLIQKTLACVEGEVRLTMFVNGIIHVIKRNSKNREILLKIGESEFKAVTEDDIRRLVPIQAYSQKQLSDVGVRTDELKRFIYHPVSTSLDAIRFELRDIAAAIRTSYSQLLRKNEINSEINNYSLELESLNSQLSSLRSRLIGVSSSDQEIINKKSKFDQEINIINQVQENIKILQDKTNEFSDLLRKMNNPFSSKSNAENIETLNELELNYEAKTTEIKATAETLKSLLSIGNTLNINTSIQHLQEKRETFIKVYEETRTKSQSNKKQLIEIEKIENRLAEINNLLAERRTILNSLSDPEKEFSEFRQKWVTIHNKKLQVLIEQAKQFSLLSKKLIRAEISSNIDFRPIRSVLKTIFEGTRIQETRIDAIITFIKQHPDSLEAYFTIIDEFRVLAETNLKDDKFGQGSIVNTLYSHCGFSDDHITKLCMKMKSEDWLKLMLLELDFNPEFWYRTNNQLGDEIPFAEASAGQQATALLTVLLNQPGIPLIIDQPEDDIDNKAMDDIIKNIWAAKKQRQLIFTSHNANLVVNGDAELVVCCDYKESSSQTRGVVKCEGAIDTKAVRTEITSVMEGGEKAFKLRKEKYGF